MRKGVLVLFTAFVLAASSARAVDTIIFDPDGAGPIAGAAVQALDPAPGNALSTLTGTAAVGSVGLVLFQANLGDVQPAIPGVTFGAPGNPAFTVIAGFNETVTGALINPGVSSTLTFGQAGATGTLQGFFKIYAHTANGTDLTGACFAADCGGTLVLSGAIINNSDFFGNFSANLANPTGNLDQSADGNQWVGTTTVTGGGHFGVDILVQSVNAAYFPNLIAGTSLVFNGSDQELPFKDVNPSRCFSSDGVTSCNFATNVGATNGLSGPQTLLQSDAHLTFQGVTAVPEPASLTLLGLGLFGTAAARRRQNRKNASK